MYVTYVWIITLKLEWTENQLQELLPVEDKNHGVVVVSLKNNVLLVRWLSSNLLQIKKEIERILIKAKKECR
ncbi:hypothetical protein NCCP28_31440 [Niallia sp. NCCP-28]|nr:hypothetical protein NCCP28_31440 [Niallia sp. NCCP-28]